MIKVQKTSKTVLSMPETSESRFRGSLKIIIRFRSTNTDTDINEHTQIQIYNYTITQIHKYTNTQIQIHNQLGGQHHPLLIQGALLKPPVYPNHSFKSEYHLNQRRGLCVCNYLWHKEHSYRRQFGTSVRFSTFDQLQHIFYNSLIVMSQMGLFCA